MSSRSFCPRLQINKIQSNVLMAQIRAQKKKYQLKSEIVLTPNKIASGRKHLRLDLYPITDIINNTNQSNKQKSTGKRYNYNQRLVSSSRSPDTKKRMIKFHNLESSQKQMNYKVPQSPMYGKKRFDHSPNNQMRQSFLSPLKFN